MPDRDEVIKGLEDVDKYFHRMTEVCYHGDEGTFCELKEKVVGALEMLKEQEPVEPVEPTFKQDYDGIFVWACGSCGAYMYHIYEGIDKAKEYAKYCRQCGRPVKWNDRPV